MSEQNPPDENGNDEQPVRRPLNAGADDVETLRKTQHERTIGIIVIGIIVVVGIVAFIIYPPFHSTGPTASRCHYARRHRSGGARTLHPLD